MNEHCNHTGMSLTSRLSVWVRSRPGTRETRLGLVCALVVSACILLLVAITPAHARLDLSAAPSSGQPEANSSANSSLLLQPSATNLAVSIVSLPWVPLDSNKPASGPVVFIVEAAITNTGATTATGVMVNLNYHEDPANNWVLLPGEYPTRTIDSLTPSAVYHAYWFARYSTVIGASHQYTVTAMADNASAVATSHNAYGDPTPGQTVQTKSFASTGNSGAISTTANIVVGVAFTVTVEYDLGTNPQGSSFSPTGDPLHFDAGAYRLMASQVGFYNDAGTWQSITADRLYFPTLDSRAQKAEVTYTFMAVAPAVSRICPYATIDYQATDKYDQFYCSDKGGTIIPITGTLTLSLTKQASALTIQQDQLLTFTIRYTNTGSMALSYGWVWDDVPPGLGSIITPSIQPPSNPAESNGNRVAWYLGTIPPGGSGTFTFAVLVDGNGQDLDNNTAVINRAFFGINPGSLPPRSALASAFTTFVQAPTIDISKTDGQATVRPGNVLTYTLRITNSGSLAATGLVVTDVLPSDVILTGSTTPVTTSQTGRILVWNLNDLAPNGGTAVITIPATVVPLTPDGTILTNTMQVKYANMVGHIFAVRTATDTTLVQAPVLTISKSDFPDPVLIGRLLTYTLRYTNSGSVAATNALITDVAPLSTTYQTCNGGTHCGIMSNGVVSWTIDNIASNTNGSVSFSVLVSESLQSGDVIRNDIYGISADQVSLKSGLPVTTVVKIYPAIIDGYTFVDLNGNGARDAGEGPLAGITVTLPDATVPITFTDSAGYYRFRVEYEKPISVTAALTPTYFRTTPGTVLLVSTMEQTQTVNFGYAPLTSTFGIIYGTVFADANHNGIQDTGENGLPDVSISSDRAVTPTVSTNGIGQYTLRYTISGTVRITETNPAWYVSTTPDAVQTNAITGSTGPSPINFGDLMGIMVTGTVFTDANANGLNDDGVGGVSGATVTANGDITTTRSSGVYTLYVTLLDTSPVTVTETAPAGYLSTNAVPGSGMSRVNANTLRIDNPVSGTLYSGDFGNVQANQVVTISGQVWNDNGTGACLANGLLDCGEPGLQDAVVSLNSGLSQTTDRYGIFVLYALPGRAITVTESNLSGYASTNAIPGNAARKLDNDTLLVSDLSAGSASTGNLFGDVLADNVAVITGTVFNDQNQSGSLDAGEPGLPGITVTLEISGGNAIAVLTGPDGRYQLAVPPGTSVRITSARPTGAFYATTPESLVVQSLAPGVYPNNNFGYSNQSGVAVISGIVFDDANSNGNLDPGESGLAGVLVSLSNGVTTIATTGGSGLITGTFTFSVTQPGIYTLRQQNLPGYRSTTPDELNIPVELGHNYFVLFGDIISSTHSSVYGVVFDDRNGNGRQDSSEPGLSGVVISLTVGTGVTTTVTRAFGEFIPGFGLDVNEQGWHMVSEQDPARPGYHSTTPDNVVVFVEMGKSYNVNFGDVESNAFGSIMGTVFDDWNGDGVQQISEPGLAGVAVSLSNGMTTTTDGHGLYTFAVTDAGVFRVAETDPATYHSTTPNTVTVQVELGNVYVVNFGDNNNSFVASVMGTVFEDQNANGVQDSTELGLSGVTVRLSDTPLSYVTNQWGQYTFQIESAGIYIVIETDLPNYFSTTPNTVTLSVALDKSYQVDFGDALVASAFAAIYGTVFDDANGNGTQDANEMGIQGVTVTLDGGKTTATNIYGGYTFSTTMAGQHTVVETDPLGFISTTPNAVTLGVTLGDSYRVDFGDRTAPTCAPDDYEEDDSAALARGLGSSVQAHNFCEDATDWITFTAQANNVYTLTTRAWGQRADTILALYGTDGVTLLEMNDDHPSTTDFSSRMVWRAPANGVYYVQITNRGGLTGRDTDYELWKNEQVHYFIYLPVVMQNSGLATTGLSANSRLSPLGVITHTLPDAYEVDDTWQQAKPIVPGQVQTHTFDSPTSDYVPDKDYVRFRALPNSVVTFTVLSATGTVPTLELYGPTGDPYLVQGRWITRSLVLTWTVPDQQYYYLAAYDPGATIPATYALRMEGVPVLEMYLPVVMRIN